MDVRYINPFIDAIKYVFETIMTSTFIVGKPHLKTDGDQRAQVVAIIRFSGNVNGSVALCFSRRDAVSISNEFACTDYSVFDREHLADSLGELANMVAGQAKVGLPETGITLSLPEVVMAAETCRVEPAGKEGSTLVLPCDCTHGRFSVEVTMQAAKGDPFSAKASTAAFQGVCTSGPVAAQAVAVHGDGDGIDRRAGSEPCP
jgi:chemotaxis protein CheX